LVLSDPESQPINALPEYPIEAAVAELRFPETCPKLPHCSPMMDDHQCHPLRLILPVRSRSTRSKNSSDWGQTKSAAMFGRLLPSTIGVLFVCPPSLRPSLPSLRPRNRRLSPNVCLSRKLLVFFVTPSALVTPSPSRIVPGDMARSFNQSGDSL
jgi:hypothetical protein